MDQMRIKRQPKIMNITDALASGNVLYVKNGTMIIVDKTKYLEQYYWEKFDKFTWELGQNNACVQKYDTKRTPLFRYLVSQLKD